MTMAPPLADAPYVEWSDLERGLGWKQDEHVSIIGPTGGGKTRLGLGLLDRRPWSIVIGTKPSGGDPELERYMRRHGLRPRLDVPEPGLHPRAVVWPPYKRLGDEHRQKPVVHRALAQAFTMGGWTLFADEVAYLADDLGLSGVLKKLWRQGRSQNLSIVAGTQRPAWVPKDIYSAPTHLFFFRTNDDDDLRRISGLNGVSSRSVRECVADLDHQAHEFLYVNTRTGAMARSSHRNGKAPR